MAEALCKNKWMAPWLAMAATVIINLIAIGYWSGSIQAHQAELDRRVTIIEASDREQSRWLERIASIESSVNYIRDAVRDGRERRGQ